MTQTFESDQPWRAATRMQATTLVDILRARADQHPQRSLYTFLKRAREVEQELTFGALDARARAIAAHLQDSSQVGDCAAVICPNDLSFTEAFMGCQYAGVVPVPTPPLQGFHAVERLRAVFNAVSPVCIVTTSTVSARLMSQSSKLPVLADLPHLCIDKIADHDREQWRAPAIDDTTLAFLQFTSGSLSAPKGVKISHGNILHNLSLLQRTFEHDEHSRIVSWLPFFHDWGLIGGLLQPLYSGVHGVLFDPLEFIRKPMSWLQVISRFGATLSGAPNFAYERCTQTVRPEDFEDLNLGAWNAAIVGAEPIRAETLDRFTACFAQSGFEPRAFYPSYGLAESTLMVTGTRKSGIPVRLSIDRAALESGRIEHGIGTDVARSRTLVSCGPEVLEQRVCIVDTDLMRACEPMRIGEIWVSGPSVGQGYWGLEADSADCFAATLDGDSGTRWLRTGDEGFIYDGELYVTGRIKDLIIVHGRNLYPEDIERVVSDAHPALNQGRGAAFSIDLNESEQLIVVHELEFGERFNAESIVEEVRRAVVGVVGVPPATVALVKVGSVPLTTSGKVQRRACKNLYLGQALPCLHEWRTGAV